MDDKNAVARTFNTTKEEQEHISNWLKEHAKTCPILLNPVTRDWLGSPIHYIFTPCSFCTSIRVQCNFGAEFCVPADPDLM